MKRITKTFLAVFSILIFASIGSGAYFSDTTIITENKYEGKEFAALCNNFPGPNFCPRGLSDVIIVGYDDNGCAIYDCREPELNTKVVINEVYYDVDSEHGSESGANIDEWVELYNNSDENINLKDWKIGDGSGEVLISHSNTYIPSHGFLLLAKSASTWSYWDIAAGAEKVSLGQKIGGGLNNSGDSIILIDSSDKIVDQISYGNDTSIFNPAITDVAEGHSISRNPNGRDTDSILDFIDLISPTPGI